MLSIYKYIYIYMCCYYYYMVILWPLTVTLKMIINMKIICSHPKATSSLFNLTSSRHLFVKGLYRFLKKREERIAPTYGPTMITQMYFHEFQVRGSLIPAAMPRPIERVGFRHCVR